MGKISEQTLHQRRHLESKEHMKICSLSSVKAMQIKTSMKCHCMPIRIFFSKCAGKVTEQLDSHTLVGM